MNFLSIENISVPSVATKTKSDDAKLNLLIEEIKNQFPKFTGGKIILPSVDDDNYSVSLYGSSNTAVIDNECNVIQPLEDMTVNLFYRVTNNSTGDALETDEPITVKVRGMYDSGNINRPQVIPSVREWKADEGEFSFSGNLVISEELSDVAEMVKLYIESIAGRNITLSFDISGKGDIILALDNSLPLGEEGYTVEIGDCVKISAKEKTGILYGGATITQILMQNCTVPRGIIRDYPQYPIRGFMVDTARYHMDIKFLEEVVKFAGFFKMNQVHLHLNDGAGETDSSFRIKSDKYPELNRAYIEACERGEDKLYTKEQYIAFQKAVKKYGIEVVSEIDSPSHCGTIATASHSAEAKTLGFEDIQLNGWQLDIREEKFEDTVKFVQSIFEEYIDGEEPVFQGKMVHLGTDEWLRDNELENYGLTVSQRNEIMRKYMDTMIRYLNSKGRTPVIWNGMNVGDKPYAGDTPISKDAIFQTWALSFSDIEESLKGEYKFINSNDVDLYIVPGGSFYKRELDIEKMFDDWEVGIFSSYEEIHTGKPHPKTTVATGHPLLLGAESAFWLDVNCGCSNIDLFKLLKSQIMLIVEKTWYGEKDYLHTAENFMNRIDALANYAPGVNPCRYIPANEDGIILKSNFENGNSNIPTSVKTLCDPYTVKFDMLISGDNASNAVMFEGEDGIMYYNYDNTGKIAFKRKGYTYIFDYVIPTDEMLDFAVSCDSKDTYLYINGAMVSKADYLKSEYELDPKPERTVHTFQFPLEKIGCGINGVIKNLTAYNTAVAMDE